MPVSPRTVHSSIYTGDPATRGQFSDAQLKDLDTHAPGLTETVKTVLSDGEVSDGERGSLARGLRELARYLPNELGQAAMELDWGPEGYPMTVGPYPPKELAEMAARRIERGEFGIADKLLKALQREHDAGCYGSVNAPLQDYLEAIRGAMAQAGAA